MRINSKIKIILYLTALFFAIFTTKCFAISISVNSSKSSVSPGESFTVTISGNDATGKVNISASGGTISTSNVWIENNSQTITVTAGASGVVTISASGELSSNSGKEEEIVSGRTSVTIKQPTQPSNEGGSSSSGGTTTKPNTSTTKPTTNNNNATETKKSTDSSLSILSIAEGAIVPEFNKDIKEYSLSVPNEVTILNITATPNDTKASVNVEGNTDLKEGENIVTITVTAEDGSTSKYIVKVTRSRPTLSLKTLIIKIKDQNGELIEAKLNPEFSFDIYEYTLEDLEYWVEKLEIEAISNIEGATIEIEGADNLVAGENTVKILIKIPIATENPGAEGTEEQEEIKIYTIKVNKKEAPVPPTLMGRISNWFNGIIGSIATFYSNNQEQVVLGALGFCIIALIGLSIYIIIDYKKYKVLIEKLKKITQANNIETEKAPNGNLKNEIVEINEEQNKTQLENDETKKRGGRHF